MNRSALFLLPSALALVAPAPLGAQADPGTLNITVGDADLRDILRAATADTHYNLLFDPGLDTRVQGMNLKGMSLDEILDTVLPTLGLRCQREGRNLIIHKDDSGLRFYHVDQLAMARTGSNTFTVNGSGQVIQTGGGGSGGANSAYTSTVQAGHVSDPWADLESGLMLVVFGKAMERPPAATPATATFTRGYAANGRRLLIQPNSGLVMVDADPATHKQVEQYLKDTVARNGRQVLLEARIVEVTLDDGSKMGVNWQGELNRGSTSLATSLTSPPLLPGLAGQGVTTIVAGYRGVQATLSGLASQNRLKVLSSPRLATLNNQKAILRVVREEAFALISSQITPGTGGSPAVATSEIKPMIVPVGIVLNIQPQIGDDGTITLAVNPSISEVVSERTFNAPGLGSGSGGSTTLPVVDRRDLDTVVNMHSGETLVLAGIIRSREQNGQSGVPWIRNIPLLGKLFSSSQKTGSRTELAIFITPTLVEDAGQIAEVAKADEARMAKATAEPQVDHRKP